MQRQGEIKERSKVVCRVSIRIDYQSSNVESVVAVSWLKVLRDCPDVFEVGSMLMQRGEVSRKKKIIMTYAALWGL